MNMISTGAFQTEMDASNNQPTLAEKFAAVWEKKNAKAARAGGVSLMALSLAACGSDDATTTTATTATTDTTTTTATTTTTTPAGEAFTLTTVAAGDQFALTAGDDTVTGTATTYNAADTVLDVTSTDADVMNLTIGGDLTATPTITNIETINVTHSGFTAGATNPTKLDVDVASITGATTFNFTIDATTSVNEIELDNLATGQTVVSTAATTDLDAIDNDAAITVNTTAASATSTSTIEVTSAGALTSLTVTEGAGHVDLDVTTADLDGTLTVTSAQDADIAADAATSATVDAGRDVTITSLVAATSVNITAGRDVADAANDLLDAATSVTITAGREIDGVDMDAATTVTLSAAGIDSSGSGGAERESSITGDAMTTLNVSGNGGAVEYDISGANPDALATINVTGDQSVTLLTDAANLDSLTKLDMNDSTTAGTTTLILGTTTPDNNINLSTVDESVIIRMDVNEATANVITLPANSNMVFNAAQTDIDLTAAAATASSNTANLSIDNSASAVTTHALTALTTTNMATVNVDMSLDSAATTIGTWDVGAANNLNITIAAGGISSVTEITAGALTVSGAGALAIGDNITVSSMDATGVTGAVTVTADAGNVIQTGSGADAVTAGDINVNVQLNGGNDTYNLSGDLTTAGTNTSYVVDFGDGNVDTMNVANASNTNSAAVQLTNFEKIVLANDATMRDTQLSGVSASVFGGSNSVLTVGITQATNDFSGLAHDTATMTTADNDGFVMDASAMTSAVTITGTGFDDTITGSANASALADTIVAGGGADTINVTQGGDSVTGGAGTDTISFTVLDGAFANIEGGTSDATGVVVNLSAGALQASTVAAELGTSFMSSSDSALAAGEFGYLFATAAAANSAVVGTMATVENVTGSTGADYILGSSAANTLAGSNGNDTFVGGAGNDTITLGTGTDTVVFSGATLALNGADTVGSFATADIFDFSGFLTGGAIANATTTTAITLASTTALATSTTSIPVTDGEVYIIEDAAEASIDTAAEMITELTNTGGLDAVDVATSSTAILIVGGADDDTAHYVYGVVNDATAAIATGEIVLLATVTTNITGGVNGILTTNLELV
jgi:hypothetical protein